MALNFSGKVDQNYELVEKGDYEVTLSCEWAKKFNSADPGQLIRPKRIVVRRRPNLSTITPANSAKTVPTIKFKEIKKPICTSVTPWLFI